MRLGIRRVHETPADLCFSAEILLKCCQAWAGSAAPGLGRSTELSEAFPFTPRRMVALGMCVACSHGSAAYRLDQPTTPSGRSRVGPTECWRVLAGEDLGGHEHRQPVREPRAWRARARPGGSHVRMRAASEGRDADDHGRRRPRAHLSNPRGRYSVPARRTHWCRAAVSEVRLVPLRSSPSCLCPRAPGCDSGTRTARAWGRRT
jgi:hypothetical protein